MLKEEEKEPEIINSKEKDETTNLVDKDLFSDQLTKAYRSFEESLQHRGQPGEITEIPCFLFQPETIEVHQNRKLLPAMSPRKKYTLVLDLDETLIHFEEKSDGTSQFLIRPYAQEFLKTVSVYYEVVIFTAALQDYADYVLDRMDTENTISHRLYRNHTTVADNVYQKDLSRLGRDLSKTLIVDNNAENFQLQPDNGVYIKSWYDDPSDTALLQLSPLLIDIVKKGYDDVRVAMRWFRERMLKSARQASISKEMNKNMKLSLEPVNSGNQQKKKSAKK